MAVQSTVKVKLKRAHEHAGRQYKQGDTIEVPNDLVNWLVDQDIAEKAGGSARTAEGDDQREDREPPPGAPGNRDWEKVEPPSPDVLSTPPNKPIK